MKKYSKKIVSLLLSAGMLFSAVPSSFILSSMVVVAESDAEEVHIWDGTSDVNWYDDEDTEFHISTPEQLAGLSELVNTGKTMEGKTFILDNDIYLNDVSKYNEWETTPPKNEWTSIGNNNYDYDENKKTSPSFRLSGTNYTSIRSEEGISGFSGEFDGNECCIKGLYKESLFGNVVSSKIYNIHLEDIYILDRKIYSNNANLYISGGIALYLKDSFLYSCSIDGLIKCDKKYTNKATASFIGGVCGGSETSTILNCINDANINADCYVGGQDTFSYTDLNVGGVVGHCDSRIINCVNNGEITVYAEYSKNNYWYNITVGGICSELWSKSGQQDNKCKLSNSKNTGKISLSFSDKDKAYAPVGGIVGDCCGGSVVNSYNLGEIDNSTNIFNAGGIIGKLDFASFLTNVYNVGNIGNDYAIVSDSYNSAIKNAYYLAGTGIKGTNKTPDMAIAKTEANMKKESFADALGDAFYYVEGEFPKLAFEVGRTLSEFDKTSLAFKEFGETQTLTLDTTYLGEPEWISSDTSVATVDSDGVVTAVGNGTAMIYALCSDSKAVCSVTVGYDYYLSDNELSLKKGRVHDLSVFSASTGKEVTDIDVEWSSSDDSIVSVDSEGTITTNAVGTAAITAKVADVELSCIVSVYEYQVPAVIVPDDKNAPKLSETDFTISTIDSKLLSVENYSDSVIWVSANTSIAKVNKNGLVKGVSEGNTVIYALLSDGRCLKANAVITKLEYTMGDVNLDGKFNVSDAVLLQKWLLAVPDTHLNHWENADFCEDGRIDVFDMVEMRKMLIQNK